MAAFSSSIALSLLTWVDTFQTPPGFLFGDRYELSLSTGDDASFDSAQHIYDEILRPSSAPPISLCAILSAAASVSSACGSVSSPSIVATSSSSSPGFLFGGLLSSCGAAVTAARRAALEDDVERGEVDARWLYVCLCAMLCRAVNCSDVDLRKGFISRIMRLDKACQKCLMDVISNQRENERLFLQEDEAREEELAEKKAKAYDAAAAAGASDNAALLSEIAALQSQSRELKQALSTSEAARSTLQSSVQSLESKLSSLSTSQSASEFELLDRHSAEVARYKSDISQLKSQLSSLQSTAAASESLQASLLSLRDENDVLKSQASRLPQVEESLRRARDKVSDLSKAAERLSAEEERHAECIDKLCAAEAQLATVPGIKKQLEEYRVRACDAEVRAEELKRENEELKNTAKRLGRANGELVASSEAQSDEARELQRLLVESYVGGGDGGEEMASLGSGLTEFNPAVKEALSRLKRENDDMKEKVGKFNVEGYERLEAALNDTTMKCQAFKDKYLDTKEKLRLTSNDLATALESIKTMNNDLKVVKEEAARLSNMSREFSDMSHEDSLSLRRRHSASTSLAARIAEGSLFLLSAGSAAARGSLSAALDQEAKERRSETEAKVGLERQVAEVRTELEGVQRVADGVRLAFAEYQLKHSLSDDVVKAKREQYMFKLNVSESRISQLEVEVSEAQQSLRQSQREKCKLSEDVDRLRKQGASLFGAESDMEAQYEGLQREYNALLEENRRIKKSAAAGVGGGAVGGGGGAYVNWTTGKGGETSGSSLQHLRSEYEEKLALLNEERRELIMKNSCAVSDLQKAETRSWQLDQEVAKMQERVCSLELELERRARRSGCDGSSASDKENAGANNAATVGLGGVAAKSVEKKKTPSKSGRKAVPSLLDMVKEGGEADANAGNEGAQEQCTQS